MSARIDLPSGLVTFLFTDIEGSTRLAHLLGDDYRSVLHEHRSVLRRAFSGADGAELFTEGDSLFVVFPEAASALVACVTAQRALREYSWRDHMSRPKVRMGLHSGLVTPFAGEYTSPEVHRAARVATAAHGDQILCSDATAALATREGALPAEISLRDLGLHKLRGFDGRERLHQLIAPGLEMDFPRPRTACAPQHNLPAHPTRFIGRCLERVELRRLICANRLVTVVGPGGAGKTRLAVEVAAALAQRRRDGVWFVDLSAIAEPDLAAVEVARVLGLRPESGRPVLETIADHVADRDLLLVLDTCDAMPYAARAIADRVLAGGTLISVLATSREPINAAGEVVWRIPQMRLAQAVAGSHADALALLIDRATAARGGTSPSPAEIADFGRIAEALGGLPLALELAAMKLRVLSPGQLAARIEDVLGTLDAGLDRDETARDRDEAEDTGSAQPPSGAERAARAASRHQSMRAAIEWSYRTLGPSEAWLLRRLSVFAGPVDLSAIEWLHGRDPLAQLATLVDKSLVQAEPGQEDAIYRMVGPIRAFAASRLAQAGEEAQTRDVHLEWCLRAIEACCAGAAHATTLYTLDPLAQESRAALRWAVTSGGVRKGFAIVSALGPWWGERGLAREGRMWLFRLYDRMGVAGHAVPDSELSRAYHIHSTLASSDGEHGEALRFSRQAEDHARHCASPALVARILASRGAALIGVGRHGEAERSCIEAISLARRSGVPGEALLAVCTLAELLWRRGSLDRAADLLATARPAEAAQPAQHGKRTVDMMLGLVALSRGDLVAAHEYLLVALRSNMRHGFSARAGEVLGAIGVRCALGGDPEAAARLFGAAQAVRARLRCSSGGFGSFWADHHGSVRATLGDAAFDEAYAQGSALSLEDAAAFALAVEHPDLVAGSVRF